MAARAIWKGQLRLSLVSIPVELYSAKKSSAKIRFRQIHQPSGQPVKYEKVVKGIGPVDPEEIVKGYQYDEDNYLLLEPDEIESIKLSSRKTLELVQFVGACEIPPIYFDKPYYLFPTDNLAEDAYRVVRDALRKTEKIGLGQISFRGREYLVAIKPCGDGLLMETLHYAEEVRDADPVFSSIEDKPVDKELLEVAQALIDKKTSAFKPDAYSDNYQQAMQELIDKKLKSKKSSRVSGVNESADPEDKVIDLMAALKKSLKGASARGASSGSKSAGKSAGKSTSKPKVS
ncbi:non-homologous end joining protein Ku [Bowmanella dokdonensis]|uniref:Non-homologous end joining protein Ku n=1 Tax=Bowmanella dokdonensis TaxID=751969 RepID=A0A939DM06_9ALTE|nr:Ku protein [Bowmanella dokdonensis]MBN7824301.1 Ku protein [Bowmanella dokdonensis]